jgi:hypothetical protein
MPVGNAPEFRTSDLYFAAYLKTAGVEMRRAERSTSGKVQFVFDTSIANIDELTSGWVNNSGKVPANTYAFNIKSLKSICHMQ